VGGIYYANNYYHPAYAVAVAKNAGNAEQSRNQKASIYSFFPSTPPLDHQYISSKRVKAAAAVRACNHHDDDDDDRTQPAAGLCGEC
jgi:hypothetical protein